MASRKLARHILTVLLMLWSTDVWLTPISAASTPPTTPSSQTSRRISRRLANGQLVEEFSFLIKEFKIDHQGKNNLNIKVQLRYKPNIVLSEYPDFRSVAKDIENFLTGYPNETDYWEIVNKKLTQLVLDKYSAVVAVTSEIEVSPTTNIPYWRSSTTTRVRGSARVGRQ